MHANLFDCKRGQDLYNIEMRISDKAGINLVDTIKVGVKPCNRIYVFKPKCPGLIKLLRDCIETGKCARTDHDQVAGFELKQACNDIAWQAVAIIFLSKEILEISAVETAQAFAGTEPHETATILHDGINYVVCKTITRSIVGEG